MVENPRMAEEPVSQVGTVSPRAWLALAGLALVFGSVSGWAARAHTSGDRYLIALVERNEAEKRFFDKKLDQMIRENERGMKPNGKNPN